jgi:EamA-like transporter family.
MSREQYKWMSIAGFFLFLGSALQQAGMQYTTAGNAGFITSLYVVLIPILLFFFWGEKPHLDVYRRCNTGDDGRIFFSPLAGV